MVRSATLAVAALVGSLLAGCSGGFGQPGASLPAASDGVQTVSDAADALDAHRSSASESAKAAIGVTDALGAFLRDISEAEHVLAGERGAKPSHGATLRAFNRFSSHPGKEIISGSDLVFQPSLGNVTDFCQSSAGYSKNGIPSLDVTFGWQSGAFSGGARAVDERGIATWSTNASGAIVQGAIGALSIRRSAGGTMCPMAAPAYTVDGADIANAFSIPLTIIFHHGRLSSLSVGNARFANGESLDVTTTGNRQGIEVQGVIRNGRTQLASFRANASGKGTLAITSTGAQYAIADWIVVSI
jgi:hypothetical protein